MEIPAIKFGTDGWRGIIADDFTYDNVALVGSAIARYLEEDGHSQGPVLIGYDRRFAAENYAAHLAAHLRALGREVVVHSAPAPTPMIAFGVDKLKAAGAIQLTASHNPHYYQGLKFIPHFAGPAMPAATERITTLITELAPGFSPPAIAPRWDGSEVMLRDSYFAHLETIINTGSLAGSSKRVLYNPMHGVGAGYLDEFLERAGVDVESINTQRDVYFGGILPDPSPANLTPLTPLLVEHDCHLLIGTDGDADRFGLVDRSGHYFGANQALPLLADYLVRYKQMKGELIRTVSTSHLLDGVAKEHGLDLTETAVGFKYVGDRLRQGGLIGGEESGGISVQGHIPEKDAILASVLILEMIATCGAEFGELLDDLMARIGPRSFVRVDQQLDDTKKQRLFSALSDYAGDKFAGKTIVERNILDGVKYVMDDGSWVLMRPSGTEPLIRVYIETTPDNLSKWRGQVLSQVSKLSG